MLNLFSQTLSSMCPPCAACIALMAGMPVCKGGELRPKNHFRPLLLEPLDAAGCPTWMQVCCVWVPVCFVYMYVCVVVVACMNTAMCLQKE